VSVCSALLIVKVMFFTTYFMCFSTFLVNKADHYLNIEIAITPPCIAQLLSNLV